MTRTPSGGLDLGTKICGSCGALLSWGARPLRRCPSCSGKVYPLDDVVLAALRIGGREAAVALLKARHGG